MKWIRILKWSALTASLVLFALFEVAYWTSTNDCGRSIPAGGERMKAIRFCEYGPPEVIKLDEIEKPVPRENELLVRVRAAALNAIDVGILRGPLLGRLIFGLRKPAFTGFARDFAGIVEAVGKNVPEFKPSDEVFGLKGGAVAEYVCARKDRVVLKPANTSFEQASAVPLAGLTALQGLKTGKIHAGQKVLINGASGGVGTFALQIAKAFEAEVTAVVSTRNVEIARKLGADRVIDYTKEDFTKGDQRYDLLFDNVMNHSMSERRRMLKPRGICVLAGFGGTAPSEGQVMGRIARGFGNAFVSGFSNQKFERYTTSANQEDLKFLNDLMGQGKLIPFVEKTWPMTETRDALRYFNGGHVRGKLVVKIDLTEEKGNQAAETVRSVGRTREVIR
jgi:NADPH:quinone reductase-like Zn-dependent oxidoreductase